MRSMKKFVKVLAISSLLTFAMSTAAFASYWQYDGTHWKFSDETGARAHNQWISWEGNWYHLNNEANMDVGWFQDGETWYYAEPNGVMRTAALVEDGVTYIFDENGACQNYDDRYYQ